MPDDFVSATDLYRKTIEARRRCSDLVRNATIAADRLVETEDAYKTAEAQSFARARAEKAGVEDAKRIAYLETREERLAFEKAQMEWRLYKIDADLWSRTFEGLKSVSYALGQEMKMASGQ